MKSDKIPTSPRGKRCERLNWLSREASADRSGTTRSDKLGHYHRGLERADSWARWMLESRHGVVVPPAAVLTGSAAPGHFDEYLFVAETEVRGWWENVTGPRGGRRKPIWHNATTVREPVTDPFEIPEWCRPVRFADNWHACHQAGLSLDECETSGCNLNYHPEPRAECDLPLMLAIEPRLVPSEPRPDAPPSDEPPEPVDAPERVPGMTRAAQKQASHAWNYGSNSPLSQHRVAGAACYGPPVWPVSSHGSSSNIIPLFLTRKSPDTG